MREYLSIDPLNVCCNENVVFFPYRSIIFTKWLPMFILKLPHTSTTSHHTHHMKYSKRINRLLLLCHFGYFFSIIGFWHQPIEHSFIHFCVMTIYVNLINKQQSNKPPEIHSWFLTVFFFSILQCFFALFHDF